jgi:hypothetical protein
MNERSQLIAWIRGEVVGPAVFHQTPAFANFRDECFIDPEPDRKGGLAWRASTDSSPEEVLYFERETPHRKYGAGLLHPAGDLPETPKPDITAAKASDPLGADDADEDESEPDELAGDTQDFEEDRKLQDDGDDFEVTSPDIRHLSTIGVSYCVQLQAAGRVQIRLPVSRRFSWQSEGDGPIPLNGRYERCKRQWTDASGKAREADIWRRWPAVLPDTCIIIEESELAHGKKISRDVPATPGSPISLRVEVFPRRFNESKGGWLLTTVLRNVTKSSSNNDHWQGSRGAILYQTFFEISVEHGVLASYPESLRPFEDLDSDERSLALLYRESATWAIGHGCAAGWDADPGCAPNSIFADVMPTVELPSMTADIRDADGIPIQLSMRELAELPDSGQGPAWDALEKIIYEYGRWIQDRKNDLQSLSGRLPEVALKHIEGCEACLDRMRRGGVLLRTKPDVRTAFKLSNLAMLLQQIATKLLSRRPLECRSAPVQVKPVGPYQSPWEIYKSRGDSNIGKWRAFQIAFLLMSLEGVSQDKSEDRDIVDLIWFPTGGGKTEAYLGVMAFYIFHERFLMSDRDLLRRDGTNVLMRYTLRMLTTQQFQRAAALISAMEFLRRHPEINNAGIIPGIRFSIGLWIGGEGSPNNIESARAEIGRFRRGDINGNPLILTECPWCRAEIGRFDGQKPSTKPTIANTTWNTMRVSGIGDLGANEGPALHCTDSSCDFGKLDSASWLPVEVIDERIYRLRPSLVIGTADKLAMLSYRPFAGALFGRSYLPGAVVNSHVPPGLIIQDELHLISGPLGTMYALYEGIFERLCTFKHSEGRWIKPKLIASTATIRGASDQVKSLYDRSRTQLFPNPGLLMGDSFFGTYSKESSGKLSKGRLYLGIHANDYGSILTTQVRTYSSALFRPYLFSEQSRDPWWSLLVFYNSIRELGGAKTLFESDIRSRLKFLFNREGFGPKDRRNLRVVEELTSRLSQAEIVGMMDLLSAAYSATNSKSVDACLASNIIEVGVDIDRLSLMGVVGQPKTTAQYIQVTGRVGRRWETRPGLILMIYNPSKSRDRSHFEQFHSYHRRLYERVEPTSATPFAVSAIQRALPGALIAWARQASRGEVNSRAAYEPALEEAMELLRDRCKSVQISEDIPRSIAEMERVYAQLLEKWGRNPQAWEEFPPNPQGHYLMLWPGQYKTKLQENNGFVVPSSMRQVDSSAELGISPCYTLNATASGVGAP